MTIKKETEEPTLTYTPFADIWQLVNGAKKDKKPKEENK